ncbi:hypothetical protein ACWE42_16800 [Sutcliffiella cohnii]
MIPDCIKEQIRTHCEFVKTGKPASSIAIQERFIDDVITLVDSYNLFQYIEPLYEGWKTIWIYRYSHILEVIKESPQVPKTKYDHWVLGKLFGYDEASIQDFLTKLV